MAWRFNPFTCKLDSYTPDTGEVNTASNVGSGDGLFKQKNGVDLEFKTLNEGPGITITETGANDLEIEAVGEANTASNVESGAGTEYGWWKQKNSLDLEFKSIKQGSGITLTENDYDITIASPDQTVRDTIIDNKRFTASLTGLTANDWFFENGTDFIDSRARWDGSSRELLGGGFRLGAAHSSSCWIAPFSCQLKGFICQALISTDDLGFRVGLFYVDPTLQTTFTNNMLVAVISTSSNNTQNEREEVTGTCDISLTEGDWVLPAVSRDGYSSTETIYGNITFYLERN